MRAEEIAVKSTIALAKHTAAALGWMTLGGAITFGWLVSNFWS
jgi:hypothetical protein